jgi:CubicO group peptidase (beta-lactamase class C family)
MISTTPEVLFSSLVASIPAEMERLHIPGVAIGIVYKDQIFTAGFGVTNLENPLPVTAKTLFQVGSISKTFTALGCMRLVEQGKLALDTPLRAYLPGLRLADEETAQKVTLRHLLTHCGGWTGDFFDDTGQGEDALERAVAHLVNLPQETPLGKLFSYNNAGFYIAGRLIEVASGLPYEYAMRSLVLEPLGLPLACYFAHEAITYRTSAGHSAVYAGQPGEAEVLRPWGMARCENSLGGLLATIDDLLIYAQFQMGDGSAQSGKCLLSPAGLEAMHTPGFPAANGEQLGLSWFIREIDNQRILRHGGATNGQMATLQIVPACGFALVVLTNSDRGSEFYTPLAGRAFELFLGLIEPEPQILPATAAVLAAYSGRYHAAAEDLILEVISADEASWTENTRLADETPAYLRLIEEPHGGFPAPDSPPPPAPPPVRLAFCGLDVSIVLDEPGKGNRGEFIRSAEGALEWLRYSGRLHKRT